MGLSAKCNAGHLLSRALRVSDGEGPGGNFRRGPFPVSGGKLQVLLVGLDHLLDHLAADRAGLTGSQIAVVAILQIHADLLWCVFTTKIVIFLRSIHTKVCYF